MRTNYYVCADLHLGHKKLAQELDRPDNVEQIIFSNIRKVEEHSILINLGDVAFGKEHEWHLCLRDRTKAKSILVLGNHDKRTLSWYYNHGWDFVCSRFDLFIFGQRIAFSHRPVIDDGSFDLNVHGHFHNCLFKFWESDLVNRLTDKHVLIKMEHSYAPFNLQHVIANKKDFMTLNFR